MIQARRSWIPSWTPGKLITRICPNARNVPFHSLKRVSCFFGKLWFSDLPITWLLIKWLACHMASRSQLGVAAIINIIHLTSPSWWRHHFAFTKMADSQKYWQKYTQLSPSNYTFFGLIFQKPLTCIRNNIVLHAYFYLKCNENSRKAAYHAQLLQRVVCYALCVCDVRLPDFAPFYPIDNNGRC